MTNSTTASGEWLSIPTEDLQVGDVICYPSSRRLRVTAIRPYIGPLRDILFGILETDLGVSISLEIGGMIEVAVRRTPCHA